MPNTRPVSRTLLLVSVSRADEVAAALAGGADVLDAKEPARGPLGAVAPEELRAIVAAAGGAAPVSAAIGDPEDDAEAERAAREAAAAGARWVKLGFLRAPGEGRVRALVAAAIRGVGATGAGVIAAAYADAERVGSAPRAAVVRAAAAAGAAGVLLDTAAKDGATLWALVEEREARQWVGAVHAAGMLAALAGSLDAPGVAAAAGAGADVAGVRGAACEGGRSGRVSAERVRRLAAAVGALAVA